MPDPDETTPSPTLPPAPSAEDLRAIGRVQWWLDTVVAMSSALRDAGVSSIAVGECSVSLLPKPAPVEKLPEIGKSDVVDDLPALHDPRSYPGGVVPGYTIEKLSNEDF